MYKIFVQIALEVLRMKTKTIMSLAIVLALTACGGVAKGEKKEKSEFDTVAAQRVKVAESGYKKATMKMKHYQKIGSQSGSATYTVKYQLSNELEWGILDSDLPSTLSNFTSFVGFTMDKAEQFLTALQTMAPNAAPTYYVAETASTLEISGIADSANVKGKLGGTAQWNEYGMLTKWHEKDDCSYYQGLNNVIIEETLTITYSK